MSVSIPRSLVMTFLLDWRSPGFQPPGPTSGPSANWPSSRPERPMILLSFCRLWSEGLTGPSR
eukprot:3115642-Alexandrium_andersonii.AAC.1